MVAGQFECGDDAAIAWAFGVVAGKKLLERLAAAKKWWRRRNFASSNQPPTCPPPLSPPTYPLQRPTFKDRFVKFESGLLSEVFKPKPSSLLSMASTQKHTFSFILTTLPLSSPRWEHKGCLTVILFNSKCEMNRFSKGYKHAVDKIWNRMAKKQIFGPKAKFWANKKHTLLLFGGRRHCGRRGRQGGEG